MVKAQVKGLSMQQSDIHLQWKPSGEDTWSSTASSTTQHSLQSSVPSLKRQRSVSTRMSSLPPLPKLSGEIILDVYTHRSLRFKGAPINEDSDYGDNERLAILGEKALETAVTDTLFRKRPMLKAEEIEIRRSEILCDASYEHWVSNYKLRDKLRCSPEAVHTLDKPEEMKLLFHSYVGAVYATTDMLAVQNWIGPLVDEEYEPKSAPDVDMDPPYNPKKVRMDTYSAPPEPAAMPPPPPPPPSMNPPPMPPPPNSMNPMSTGQQTTAFLPLFNQTANQRRVFVEYPAVFSGPAHAGRWTVKCVVNGMEKGIGSGPSKQLAKEEAAKQAYFAMGWAPRG